MIGWFGKSWGAPVCEADNHAPTPVGKPCMHCGEAIEEGDQGFIIPHGADGSWSREPWHYECHMRGIVGGLNHVLGLCTCCGGTLPPDPPDLPPRVAARVAVQAYEARGRPSVP